MVPTPKITDFYIDTITDMIGRIEASQNGKRYWTYNETLGYTDYSGTTRSTFPEWARCFFREEEWRADKRESLRILRRALTGYAPAGEKNIIAFQMMIDGVREEQYMEEQYWKGLF